MKKIKTAGALVFGLWLLATGVVCAQSPVVIDNGAAEFTTIGTWPTSTVVPGFEGANYQTHEAQGNPPGAVVVDNADPGFTVTGTWPVSTAVSGFLGANYQVHVANGEEPAAIVVDNTGGTTVGTWPTSTSVSGFFGSNYQVHAAGTGGDSFTWTPTIPATGTYLVYARWTQHPNRSTHAVYTVNHAGGATPVTVNQEQGGGTWQLLGTFTLNAGSSHSVVLALQDDGYVIADAIKVVPQGAPPNTATWTPTVPTAKAYHVYARWTAHPNRATDAQYTVTHAGGDITVTVNQEVNNGAWFLLGTFNLAPDSGHKVALTDQANGYVIADAIRIIGTDEPQANSATWSPNLTGEHQVYAKWTQHANRATNATYTITHAGGSTQVPVNQQANGGQFNLLGTFTLTPASTITLTDNADGYVIADAVQLIATAPVAAQMYFVHTDHLNTPRLITNQAGQAVWRWDQGEPFGDSLPNENPSGLGIFTCNLRLPGQYFDQETGLHYNYFRDYDPGTGRYAQSDPIGLNGRSFSTYGYVNGNPLKYIDSRGLEAELCSRPFYPVPIPYAEHCFIRFDGNDSDTSSYDTGGTHADPAPSWWPKSCQPTKGEEDDDCVKREMKKCKAEDYDFTGNNCCHCAEKALKACGLSIPVKNWPNWPVNPGPQPGEKGSKQ